MRLAALPAEDYSGDVPAFPLPEPSARELELWQQSWTLPHAHVWAVQEWRWHAVAMWVRQTVRCEAHKVSATHLAQLHRFADQIGMTDSGLAAMGYRSPEQKPATPVRPARRTSARDRITVIDGGQAS